MKPEDLQLLVTRTMPFGKYKGRILADLPGNYLRWFVREGVPKGEIGRLLALMHEIDHNGLSENRWRLNWPWPARTTFLGDGLGLHFFTRFP
jgi:hypothetical protein